MAGELGTNLVTGLQNMPADYQRYLAWLQSQQSAQPQAPNAYAPVDVGESWSPADEPPAAPPAPPAAVDPRARAAAELAKPLSPRLAAAQAAAQPQPEAGPSLRAAPDTARSRIRGAILGNERNPVRQELANKADTLLDFIPGLGNAAQLQEAKSATDVALATLPPVAGKVGRAVKEVASEAAHMVRPRTTGDVIASSILEPRTASAPRAMSPEELQRGALWSHTEGGPGPQPIQPGDTRVSTRFPKAVSSTEDPLRTHLSIGSDEMRLNTPDKQGRGGFQHNVELLRQYPGFERLKDMDDLQAVQEYLKQAQDNLRYLHDRSPQMMKDRSPLWYEGAHEIADALAQRWGIPRRSASALLASLSPQMDWFKNASLGERLGDIMTSAAAGRRMTPEMEAYARTRMGTREGQFLKPGSANEETYRQIQGKTLDELETPMQKAMWIRMRDEAHNPRPYRSVTPEGNFGDWIMTDEGKLERVGWGSFGEIQKAVRAMESGGDMDLISRLLGGKHKVRSFYNNIERPNDPRFGDITADTHAVAAAQMRPLSGKSAAVEHNLASGSVKGRPGVSSSDVTGVQGTYGWTADATRRFAEEVGMLPRAAQSATWEPVRTLFTDTWKRGMQPGGKVSNPDAVDAIWREFDAGKITADQARDRIFDLAGGIKEPEWGRSGLRTTAPTQGSTYR